MNGLRSPDIPAYVSYAVVFIVGAVVALTSVNSLLAEKRDRWAYGATWLLFFMYALLPTALFWLLAYNGVISDTSLFAAVVTAVAYQYVFTGAVEGIRMPGQTAAVWRLFQAWVDRIQQRIDRLNQARHSKLTERFLSFVAPSATHLQTLEQLACERSLNPTVLMADLTQIRSQPLSPQRLQRDVAKRLWDDVRQSSPDTYGDLLRREGLVDAWTYWDTFKNGRAIVMSVVMIAAAAALVLVLVQALKPRQNHLWLSYLEWRFLQSSPTADDEFRTRGALLAELLSQAPERSTRAIQSLTDVLTHRSLSIESAERVLALIVFSHQPQVTARTIPPLVDALRTLNPDIRLRVHRTLKELQSAEYPGAPLAGDFKLLADWVPAKDDSNGTIDQYMRAWRKWWDAAQRPAARPAPAASVTPVADALAGPAREFTASNLLFAFKSAELSPASTSTVEQVAQALRDNPRWELLIVGHTDDVGSEDRNMTLSKRRAQAVVDSLRRAGIDGVRIRAEGKGESEPAVPGTSQEARDRNRRVVFKRLDATT